MAGNWNRKVYEIKENEIFASLKEKLNSLEIN